MSCRISSFDHIDLEVDRPVYSCLFRAFFLLFQRTRCYQLPYIIAQLVDDEQSKLALFSRCHGAHIRWHPFFARSQASDTVTGDHLIALLVFFVMSHLHHTKAVNNKRHIFSYSTRPHLPLSFPTVCKVHPVPVYHKFKGTQPAHGSINKK